MEEYQFEVECVNVHDAQQGDKHCLSGHPLSATDRLKRDQVKQNCSTETTGST